jgi:Hypoxia induced protein conserved region
MRDRYDHSSLTILVSYPLALTSLFRHQSTSQKVVQARMWAQGLTIGVLIAAGVLTHSQRGEVAKHHNVDHSWRELLDAEAKEAESRKIKQLNTTS